LRVTLLDDTGNVDPGSDNYWVTDNLVDISVTPEQEEGADVTQKSGCDCIVASYRGPDLLKRFTFEINLGAIEPGLITLMIGGAAILDSADIVGLDWPSGTDCAADPPPKVALEVWSYNWDGNQQDSIRPYWHWVWPLTRWQIGPSTLGAGEFFLPNLVGYSEGNDQWGTGPYGDGPPSAGSVGDLGSVWAQATAPPAGSCAYQSITPAS